MPSTGSHAAKKVKLGEEVPTINLKAPTLHGDQADCASADDLDFSRDIKGIISAISAFKDKATSDVKQKNESIITSLAAELKEMLEEAKSKADKERQALIKAVSKICKDTEAGLKHETAKLQAVHEKFSNDIKAHMQAYEDIYTKYEEQKEKLITKADHQRKKDKATLEGLQRIFLEKFAEAESSLKKRKQEEKSINYLRKTLGSFFNEVNSDEETAEE